MKRSRLGPIALLSMHLLLVAIHGAAHVALGIFGSPLATAYIAIVIYAAPIMALTLILQERLRAGLALGTAASLGSFVFGSYMHFASVSNDHVCHLPGGAWQPVFQITAGLLSLVDVAALIALPWLARGLLLEPVRAPFVILIDGTCIFCNRLVARILDRDRAGIFHFAYLQSEYAQAALSRHGADPTDIDGVYLLTNAGTEDERLFVDGAAGRQIWPRLFPLAAPLLLFPRAVLDPIYDLAARFRYRLFGQYDSCRVPTEAERKRVMV